MDRGAQQCKDFDAHTKYMREKNSKLFTLYEFNTRVSEKIRPIVPSNINKRKKPDISFVNKTISVIEFMLNYCKSHCSMYIPLTDDKEPHIRIRLSGDDKHRFVRESSKKHTGNLRQCPRPFFSDNFCF